MRKEEARGSLEHRATGRALAPVLAGGARCRHGRGHGGRHRAGEVPVGDGRRWRGGAPPERGPFVLGQEVRHQKTEDGEEEDEPLELHEPKARRERDQEVHQPHGDGDGEVSDLPGSRGHDDEDPPREVGQHRGDALQGPEGDERRDLAERARREAVSPGTDHHEQPREAEEPQEEPVLPECQRRAVGGSIVDPEAPALDGVAGEQVGETHLEDRGLPAVVGPRGPRSRGGGDHQLEDNLSADGQHVGEEGDREDRGREEPPSVVEREKARGGRDDDDRLKDVEQVERAPHRHPPARSLRPPGAVLSPRPAPYRIASSRPAFSKAPMANSTSSTLRAAFMIVRIRALSLATMGNTIGRANTPSSYSRWLSWRAMALSPTITGVMGVALWPMLNPSAAIAFLNRRVCSQSRWTCWGSRSSTSTAARHAAATAGGWEPLRSQVRDLL